MFWRRLFSNLRAIRPLERRVLARVAEALAPEARERFEAQVARLTGAQQPVRGREVNLYDLGWGKRRIDESLKFSAGRDETKLATVTLVTPGAKRGQKVDVWIVGGQVFSLTFSTPPQKLPDGVEPGDVRLWLDPMLVGGVADPASLGVRLPEGVSALRSVALDDGDYVVMAERGPRMLVLRVADPTPTFYLLDAEDDGVAPQAVGTDYRAALARLG